MAAVLHNGVQELHVTLMIHRSNGRLLEWDPHFRQQITTYSVQASH